MRKCETFKIFKNVLSVLFTLMVFSSLAVNAARQNTVLLKDFRGINLFDAFYIYDKTNDKYNFVPVSNADFLTLSRENKAIYRNVLSAQKYWDSSKSPLVKANAIKYRQKAIKKNPDLIPAAYELIGVYKQEKKYSTALYYAEKVQKRDKKNRYPEISFEIGELYYLINDYENAQTNLISFLKLSDKTPAKARDAYAILSECSLKTGKDYRQSLQYAQRSLSMDKNNYQALDNKYKSLIAMKKYRAAMDTAQQLMNLKPDDYSHSLKYARCRGALGDKKTQLIYLQKAQKLAQDAPKKEQDFIALQIKNLKLKIKK